jgi:hypothetical protein
MKVTKPQTYVGLVHAAASHSFHFRQECEMSVRREADDAR